VLSFVKDDFVCIKIAIFSKSGILDPNNFKWIKLVHEDCPKVSFFDYEKSLTKKNLMFDNLRFCELENLIHVWKNEKSLTKQDKLNDFKKIFSTNFTINDISYDFSKFYIFKAKLTSNLEGKNILKSQIKHILTNLY